MLKPYEKKNQNTNGGGKRRYGRLRPVSEGMKSVEKNILSGNEEFQFWLFRQKWKNFAGDTLAEESYIARADGKTLWIYAQNSVWMQELLMHRETILRRIQSDAYGRRFTELRIATAPAREKVSAETPIDALRKKTADAQKPVSMPLTEAEKNWVSQFTETYVTSDALRDTFRTFMEKSLETRKAETAAGFTPCKNCGKLCPETEMYCETCRIKMHERTTQTIVLLLKDAPHLLYEDVRAKISCDYAQYREARDVLIHRYKENYFRGTGTADELRALLALLIHKAPETISKEEAREKLSLLAKEKRGKKHG
jgi:hypothetical protein